LIYLPSAYLFSAQLWSSLEISPFWPCFHLCFVIKPFDPHHRQQSQRERVKQWVFRDLCLCSPSGRYAYHQMGNGVIAPRKSQWSKYSQNLGLGWQEVLVAVTTSLRELFLYCHNSAISEEFTSQVHHERMWVYFMAPMLILSSCPAMSRGCRSSFGQGECGILPAFHGNNIPYYFWILALFQSKQAIKAQSSTKLYVSTIASSHRWNGYPSFSPLPPPGISCRSPYTERNCYY